MRAAARKLEFERAAELRDRIRELEKRRLGIVEVERGPRPGSPITKTFSD